MQSSTPKQDLFKGTASELYGRIFRFFVHRVSDRADAEDLAQEVFLNIYRPSGQSVENATAYAFGVASNVLLRYYRKRQLHGRVFADEQWGAVDFHHLADPSVDVFAAFNAKEAGDRLASALSRLKLMYQDVLYLYFFEELSSFQIQDLLKIPAATVRSRIRLALIALEKERASAEDLTSEAQSLSIESWKQSVACKFLTEVP